MRKFLVLLLSALLLSCSASAFAENKAYELPEEVVKGEELFEDKTLLTSGSVTVIKPQEMQGEQKSLQELLKRVPGLHIVETRGRGAYTVATIRGSSASQVSVFVDGVLMNLGTEADVDLSAIPVQNVERIEVYRGYIPAKFAGASMGGVINIVTKKPEKQEGQVYIGGGSYGKEEAGFSYSTKIGSGKFFIGGNYDTSDGDFEYVNDNAMEFTPSEWYKTRRQNNSYKNKDILMKWDNKDWNFRFSYKDIFKDQPYKAAGNDKPDSKRSATLDTEQSVISLARRFKTGKLDWGIKADYLWQGREFDNPENAVGAFNHFHNEFKTNRVGFALDGALQLGDRHLLEFLGDYSNEQLEITGDKYGFLPPIAELGRDSYNLQLQDTFTLNKAGTFWLTSIVRYNYQDGKGEPSWGIGLTNKLTKNWNAKATYGTYNRAPKMYEQYGDGATIVPNEDNLLWEDGTQWDLGVGYTGNYKDINFTADLTYFGRHSNNLIELIYRGPVLARYENIGKAEVKGVEFEGKAEWKKWELFASATYLDAKNVTEGSVFKFRSGYELPHRPRYEGTVRLSRLFLDDKLTMFGEVHYTGVNFYDSIQTVAAEKFMTTNFGLHYKFSDTLKLSAGVNDIFNKSPEVKLVPVLNGPISMLWFPLQGRTYYATLSWYF